jgi:hypothetical protein
MVTGSTFLPLSVGLREGDLGQRAALHPLIEDGLRPGTVRTAAAVESLDNDGEDTPALRLVGDDLAGRRRSRSAAAGRNAGPWW